jgi:hypothetical protein
MTGSTTTAASEVSRMAATRSTTSAVPSIPVLIASAPMSSSTARACCSIRSSGRGKTPETPSVFCTVMAVIAVAA